MKMKIVLVVVVVVVGSGSVHSVIMSQYFVTVIAVTINRVTTAQYIVAENTRMIYKMISTYLRTVRMLK